MFCFGLSDVCPRDGILQVVLLYGATHSVNPTRHPAQAPLIPATQLVPLRPAWPLLTYKEDRKGKGRRGWREGSKDRGMDG